MTDHFSRFLSASPSRNMERVAIRRRDRMSIWTTEDALAWMRTQEWGKDVVHVSMTNKYFAFWRRKP